MTRLPLILSALALAVALAAAGLSWRTAEQNGAVLDRAAVEAIVAERQGGPTKLDTEAIGPLVRDYLVANPQVLEEVLAALETKRQQDEIAAQTQALEEHAETIFRSPHSPVVGNPDGDVTLVEFFDYNCGYCKRMLPAMVDLLKSDPELKLVLKEWPVLSDGSVEAARIALAVQEVAPERYLDFHIALMSEPGGGEGINKARAVAAVERLGIDVAAVEAAAEDPAIEAALDETFKVADALGLRGTPSYVIGDEVVPGAVSLEALQEKIAKVRNDGCRTC